MDEQDQTVVPIDRPKLVYQAGNRGYFSSTTLEGLRTECWPLDSVPRRYHRLMKMMNSHGIGNH